MVQRTHTARASTSETGVSSTNTSSRVIQIAYYHKPQTTNSNRILPSDFPRPNFPRTISMKNISHTYTLQLASSTLDIFPAQFPQHTFLIPAILRERFLIPTKPLPQPMSAPYQPPGTSFRALTTAFVEPSIFSDVQRSTSRLFLPWLGKVVGCGNGCDVER